MVATTLMTVEEFERMPDDPTGVRYELVRGELVPMPGAGWDHGVCSGNVGFAVSSYVRPRRLGRVPSSDTGYRLIPDEDTVLSPDVSFVGLERLGTIEDRERVVTFPPDFVVEVVSVHDRMPAVLAKVATYLEAGVPLVWVVEPRLRTVTVDGPGAAPRRFGDGDMLDGGDVLPEFRLPVADIFAS